MLKTKKQITSLQAWKAPKRKQKKVLLDLNENQYIDARLMKKISSKIKVENIYRYPEYDDLLEELSKYTNSNKENILLTNGADQGIELIFKTFTPNKKVLIVMPTFSYFEYIAEVEDVYLEKVFYNKKFEFPINEVLKKIDETIDGIILCNPSNPLSIEIKKRHLDLIIQKAKINKKFVLIDEVYYEFYNRSHMDKISEFENLILLRSFSKGFGLAGLRLGYIISSSKNIKEMFKLRGPWDINALAVLYATQILEDDKSLSYLDEFNKIKKKLLRFLNQRGYGALNSKTNFIIIKSKNSALLTGHLKANGIYVLNLNDYPSSNNILRNYIRMSVPKRGDLVKVMEAFKSYPNIAPKI